MATDMFLDIDGIKGEPKDNAHAKRIDEQVCGSATMLGLASAPKGPLSPGARLAQHYRLLEELGDSPQGVQFLAEDLRYGRRVDLLDLSREFASDGLRLAALQDAVERVRQAPHWRLREVYGLETVEGDSVLVEEHAGGPSLLEVLRCRGALSAPEVVWLVNGLAPLVDHARAHRLEDVELTLRGIHLTGPDSSGSATQSALLQQPLTAWPELELKVNAIDFPFSCASAAGWAAAVTQVGNATAGGPRGSYVHLLGLLAYEALGGSRARVEATGRYAPVAALGEEGNAVLRRALADEWPSGGELARRLAASVGDAGQTEPVPEGEAGGGREALPHAAPADVLKKRSFREDGVPRGTLSLGLVVLVGLGSGYAWHQATCRPRLPAIETQAQWTPARGPSSPASLASAAAGAATPAWDTVPPTAIADPPPAPSHGEVDWVTAEQPTPSPVQAAPPTSTGPALPGPTVAPATLDSTLPPVAPSPTPPPAETPVETMPVPEGGIDTSPQAVVLPASPASNPPTRNNAPALEQDNAAATPAAPGPKARGRHGYRPRPLARPQPQPTFWQRLFGHKETKKPKAGKPRQ
ncbi:MAG: hypothetical protein JOY92_04130 [Verrucomicrobia bacterium]|nr:hypothetical protein [Verrucomicrobiota bacterium]